MLAMLSVWHHYSKSTAVVPAAGILPELNVGAVQAVSIYPGDKPEIRVERTGDSWRITRPLDYPAQAHLVAAMLERLKKLTPIVTIEAGELKGRSNADEEFGFKTPLATVTLEQANYRTQVVFGSLTAPGDQLFMKVIGQGEVHVVDAGLLGVIPRSPNELRDTSLLNPSEIDFNRVAVSSGQMVFEVERDPQTRSWRMIHPIDARADTGRINSLLQRLEALRVGQFITDDPKADLEAFGLQTPELEILLKQGTNATAALRIGRSPTNDAQQVFARVDGHPAIVTVPLDDLAAWRGSVNDFRSRYLVGQTDPVAGLIAGGGTDFSVQVTNGGWRILPFDWPADAGFLTDSLSTLANMHITEFTKDVVTPADLPNYGLADPLLRLSLLAMPAGTNAPATNVVQIDVTFGTNARSDRVYARRSDENSVYAVSRAEFERLPRFPAQLRERTIWNLNEEDVVGVTIQDGGKTRRLIRQAAHQWSLAPGSQGVINELAIEESVRPLCHLWAGAWVAADEKNPGRWGITETGLQVTLEMKNGTKHTIDFGARTDSGSALAAVKFAGQTWVFEMPGDMYRFVETYLRIPAGLP